MSNFRNILLVQVPGGGSADALHRAAELARLHGARLKLLSAVGEVPRLPSVDIPGSPAIDLEVLLLREHRERLEELAEPLRVEGIEAETAVRTGAPFAAIIREVHEHGHDLVLKTAEGASGIRQKLFGSTALHVIRKCPCPVWILKPTGQQRGGRILAAVDPSPDDDALQADDAHFFVNDRILELAITMARARGAEVTVAHAWSLHGESLLRGPGRVASERVDTMVEETRARHQSEVEELMGRQDWSGVDYRLCLVKGDAGNVIPSLAERESSDLIVMGSIGRTGLSGFLIGNTAETVLNRVDCSVLTVKPKGFVTPLALEPMAMSTAL
jgi:nucleotide-binding universal stress UspA family protein